MEATTSSIGAASDAIDVAEDRPYDQRPRRERAMEERAVLSPQPDEPLTRGDLPSAGREARQDKGDRREPRTSRLFGAAAANAGRGGRASPARGRFSDSGAQCGAASRVGGGRTNASSRISKESHALGREALPEKYRERCHDVSEEPSVCETRFLRYVERVETCTIGNRREIPVRQNYDRGNRTPSSSPESRSSRDSRGHGRDWQARECSQCQTRYVDLLFEVQALRCEVDSLRRDSQR